MPEADARARIKAQASDEQRRAVADELIDNSGSLDELRRAVDTVWDRLLARQAGLNGADGVK
jgi:dephospho-CoA kinase